MAIKDLLVEAVAAVDEANIPEDLRKVAFEKAFDLLSSQTAPQPFEGHVAAASQQMPARTRDLSNAVPLHGLANRLGVTLEDIQEVFNVTSDGAFEVVIGPNLLDSSNSGGTKQLALLVAGGRQLAGLEDWTSATTVREACELYNRYDMPNFAKTLKTIDDFFSFRGSAMKRELRLKRPGEVALKNLVAQLTSAGS